ncbi:hypothetical protein RND81_07G007200 [Saponaria officinalis]|uniref:WD repeat-containing protein 6 n=1 Tax=Saponaria officinalis TaxID=3572 RepID=A0AAW1JLP0_SAPOF
MRRVEGKVKGGEYLGEISALCYLQIPPSLSPLPLLVAGSGSNLLLFDLNQPHAPRCLHSFTIFHGLRVHGIASSFLRSHSPSSLSFRLAVSGERRLKLFTLLLHFHTSPPPHSVSAHLTLLHLLPTFSHWVLHFSFLQDSSSSSSSSSSACHSLAVGCSDNSLHLWDFFNSRFLLQHAQCPERCLLYSMKIWGPSFSSLVIASGTIFNEIVVWKLTRQHHLPYLTLNENDPSSTQRLDDVHEFDGQYYKAEVVSRLSGHQGSIFCLSWSNDGSTLISVSDDRSARMWIMDTETKVTDDSKKIHGPYSAGPILFGHGARVWDCCISDTVIVTAGEDCSCRVWGLDGKELRIIKEHIGRGIWRCLYDLNSSLLVTAGFDSAIKVHRLPTSSLFSGKSIKEVNERKVEVFQVCIPNSLGQTGLMDSKSEYVRCLKFARKDTIYIATNHGYVYHAKLYDNGSVEWTELVRVTEEVPVICLDLLSTDLSELSLDVEDLVAVGDGRGGMKVLEVRFCDGTPKVAARISWLAEIERQLLGAYWCKSLGRRFIFTSNPRGLLKLWRLSVPSSDDGLRNCDVHLVANFTSPFGARILSLDASYKEEVLVCGDVRGNLVLFPLSKSILLETSPLTVENTSVVTYFKGAHGISSVSSISISRFSCTLTEICSTGGDGCICYLEYSKDQHTLEFVGMKQTKELSLVQSVSAGHYSLGDSASIRYAVGFSSTDFLIWNLVSETKVLQVKCGGWRRPHSFHLGQTPEIDSSFAYVKDEIIYVHRYWVADIAEKIYPLSMHLQFHGREIHSLCIIPEEFESASTGLQIFRPKSSWIATGCEDGTVRLTSYDHDTENWALSNLLGEHVGGSAVRSLCFVSKIHSVEAKVVEAVNGTFDIESSSENNDRPRLLISVGAKRVLTSWLLRSRRISESDASANGLENNNGDFNSSPRDLSSMSFKWLSTDMPVKSLCSRKKVQDVVGRFDAVPNANYASTPTEMELLQHEDTHDDDWRYLAVTAFLVNVAQSRITVCFVVVACSDATLILRALVLPYRYWFDVASLAHLSSPVLTLQHAVHPFHFPNQGSVMTKNMYMAISGSTDGSIAFWDLTERVEAFLQRVSSLHEEKSIDIQKRPRTGRGSQGGRWWKSVDCSTTDTKPTGPSMAFTNKDSAIAQNQICSIDSGTASCGSGRSASGSSPRLSEIKPLHVLYNVHQSGVNCLHLCCRIQGDTSRYNIISGGDDQALNFLEVVVASSLTRSHVNEDGIFDAKSAQEITEHDIHCNSSESCSIEILYQKKVFSAHSSAVKGVWTDGIWFFSVGLDQRIRCWNLQEDGNLAEHCHFVTSVPEPEALDVKACGRNCFQVVVAGRGMQIIEFLVTRE